MTIPFALARFRYDGFAEPRRGRICAMLTWLRRRKERQQQVGRDADNLVALFGEGAYSEALARARHENDAGGDPRHWLAVRRKIARRIKKDIGLDTVTRRHLGR